MRQSDARVPGRGGGPPASFGREPEEAEDFVIRGGESIHLVLHLDVIPSEASLEALRTAVRENTRTAVLEGFAEAFAEMEAGAEDEPAGPGGGGAPPSDAGG